MSLEQTLRDNLKESLKTGDKVRTMTIRMLLAGITNAEKERGLPPDDDGVLNIISREVKRHKESIESFKKADRQDLVASEEAELAILLKYLPEQMSQEEILAAAQRVIEEVGATGPRDKGKVMSQLMGPLKGKADGRQVGSIVDELLTDLGS